MKIFLRYVGEFLRTYPQVRLSRNDEILIRDSTMKHLGLNNLNQLRDRYEGQAFLDKTLMHIGGLISLQRHLKLPVVDFTKTDLSDFSPKLEINGEVLDIHVFQFGTLPLINMNQTINTTFFIIQKDKVTFNLCGFATPVDINNNLINTSVEKSSPQVNNMHFTGFKSLKKGEILLKKTN